MIKYISPIFFSPGDSDAKGLLVLLHPGPGGVIEVDTDPKRKLCPLRFLPLITEFSVFMPLQGKIPGNSWLGRIA